MKQKNKTNSKQFFIPTAGSNFMQINGAKVIINSNEMIIKGLLFIKIKILLKDINKISESRGNFGLNPAVDIRYESDKSRFFLFWNKEARDGFMNYLKKAVGHAKKA